MVSDVTDVIALLRATVSEFTLTPRAVFRPAISPRWPLRALDEAQLEKELDSRGHFVALPKEPAALANVIEVSLLDFLVERLTAQAFDVRRGTERGYPDLELTGASLDTAFYAIDIKVARRHPAGRQTKSRITLFTGNTYFRYPQLRWPGTSRPFEAYEGHVDIIALYTFDESLLSRIADLELIVQEPWKIASRQRSSTTREYIGAVQSIHALRKAIGEFESREDFYSYWRKYNFKIGRAVQLQLDRLLSTRQSHKS